MDSAQSAIAAWIQPQDILLDVDVRDRRHALEIIAAAIGRSHGLEVAPIDQNSVIARDEQSGACLFIRPLDLDQPAELEPQFTSRHYGSKSPSVSACWTIMTTAPCKLRWAIVPVGAGEDRNERLQGLQTDG